MSRSDAADRFYTRWARVYDHLAHRTPGIAQARQRTVERMDVASGMTVLDMGCGPGPNFRYVRQDVGSDGRVIGIDVASGALARAQHHVERAGWDNVHAVRADAMDPPVVEADALVGAFVIGMLDDPGEIVDQWCDLVGSGGRVGLLHFARSDRFYGAIPNGILRGLVLVSTPGKRKLADDATGLLDRRVREGHAALIDRTRSFQHTTHWGGLLHVVTGIVD